MASGEKMAELKSMYSTIKADPFPEDLVILLGEEKLVFKKRDWRLHGETMGLRYGENPDQPAALYQLVEGEISIGGISWRKPQNSLVSSLAEKNIIQSGKHPGKINLTDVDNGANILQYLTAKPAAVILKHNNPCGAAWSDGGLLRAFEAAFWCDRIAAFGGAIVVNSPLDLETARFIAGNYFEVVAAPAYEEGAVGALKGRKNLRILELPGLASLAELAASAWLDLKSLADGGLIVQKSYQNRIRSSVDFLPAIATGPNGLDVVARAPTREELDDLFFAWAVEAGVSSNSVIFAKNGATVAIGTGEQDRVGCVEIAIHKAYSKFTDKLAFEKFGLSLYELRQRAPADKAIAAELTALEAETVLNCAGLKGSRMVSDGFFPFRDGVDAAISQGITAVAQPGGSLRDWEVIVACNEAVPQVAMVFTGQRSFRH